MIWLMALHLGACPISWMRKTFEGGLHRSQWKWLIFLFLSGGAWPSGFRNIHHTVEPICRAGIVKKTREWTCGEWRRGWHQLGEQHWRNTLPRTEEPASGRQLLASAGAQLSAELSWALCQPRGVGGMEEGGWRGRESNTGDSRCCTAETSQTL